MSKSFSTTAFRYPGESLILILTLILVLVVIALTATATFCLSLLFVLGFFVFSYLSVRSHHQALIRHAYQVTPASTPTLHEVVRECALRLQVEPVEVFVTQSKAFNAYTFGISSPKVIVLTAPLLNLMNAEELKFVIGHEMGHVHFGHTWLNSIVGGMAGIPSPYLAFAVLHLAFRSWNRACEFSADRAGLLTSCSLADAVSALVKIGSGGILREKGELRRAIRRIESENDSILGDLGELLGTHPTLIKRIEQLRMYARSPQYKKFQTKMNGNFV
jgi:Zn-dependent protease with chaperone function